MRHAEFAKTFLDPMLFGLANGADQAHRAAQASYRAGRNRSAASQVESIVLGVDLFSRLRPFAEASQNMIHIDLSNYHQVVIHGVANGHSRPNFALIR